MTAFTGMMRLVGDTTTLPATVEVADGAVRIRASDTDVGSWQISDLEIDERPDGFLITVEGEQLLLTPLDRSGFAAAVAAEADPGPDRGRRWRRSRSGRSTPPPTPDPAPPAQAEAVAEPPASGRRDEPPRMRRWIGIVVESAASSSRRERIVAGAAAAALVLAVFAPRVLFLIVLTLGGALILAGILGHIDDYVAVRIPAPWTPFRVIGLGVLVVGLAAVIPLLLL